MSDLVVGITGASGAVYAVRLLHVLLGSGHTVHVTVSPSAVKVLKHELGLYVDLDDFDQSQLLPEDADLEDDGLIGNIQPAGSSFAVSSVFSDSDITRGRLHYHHFEDLTAPISSGSFLTAGMIICPCSMGTLAGIATGQSTNLIHRAADVHLKERRPLIVVPRETPLGSIQLENMKRLADAGGTILPAMPAFYHTPVTIHDLVDFVVARILDQCGIKHELIKRWGS